jgi:hypothetical protein
MNAGRGRRNSDQSRDTDLASAALYDSHDRLARLETSVAGIGSTLDKFIESTDNRFRSIEESVDREGMSRDEVMRSLGRTNREFIGLVIAVIIPICSLAAFAIYGPIQQNTRQIERLGETLTDLIRRESDRNNALEREMGGVQMINELFMRGKLQTSMPGDPSAGAGK